VSRIGMPSDFAAISGLLIGGRDEIRESKSKIENPKSKIQGEVRESKSKIENPKN
jgi:hypothetical protein